MEGLMRPILLVLCTLSLAASVFAEVPEITNPSSDAAVRGRLNIQGAPAVDFSIANQVRAAFGGAVQGALTGDYENVAGYISKADRNRIGFFRSEDRISERAVANGIDREWRSRFAKGPDWSSSDSLKKAFGNYQISRGADDNHILVVIPASQGLPAVTLALVNEGIFGIFGASWRIDLPDNVARDELRDNLRQAIREIESAKSTWPADSVVAQQMVGHRVLMALGAVQGG